MADSSGFEVLEVHHIVDMTVCIHIAPLDTNFGENWVGRNFFGEGGGGGGGEGTVGVGAKGGKTEGCQKHLYSGEKGRGRVLQGGEQSDGWKG